MFGLPVVSTAPAPAAGELADQVRNSGISWSQVTGIISPLLSMFWPIVKIAFFLGVPALVVVAIGYLLFMRWSQAGVTGL